MIRPNAEDYRLATFVMDYGKPICAMVSPHREQIERELAFQKL